MSASDAVVEVHGLTKSYGDYEAVRGIDLEVRRGEILAFLGPNGAGKTTTVEILEGYRSRTGGEARVLGEDPETAGSAWRGRIGVVLQSSQAETDLSVRECLALYAGYYERPRDVEETIRLVGLEEKAGDRAARLSGGQLRRLEVGLALIGDPELVFLDEPTTGFDPSARHHAWGVVAGLRDLGKTVFLTTHFMDEAENLADRIVVLRAGRIVAEGPPSTLAGRDRAPAEITFTLPEGEHLPDALAGRPAGAGRVRIEAAEPLPALRALAAWAEERSLPLADLDVRRPSLEDIYLKLTEEAEA